MPKLTLTDFIDVITQSGGPKATKVAQIKNRNAYEPAVDFYKALRERICEVHRAGLGKDALKDVLAGLADPKKASNYPAVISGYAKWWGRKELEWFVPPSAKYSASGVDVSVNPELGLKIDGAPHVVKLHLRKEPLLKFRADLITSFVHSVLSQNAPANAQFAVLDARDAKLLLHDASKKNLKALVDAELSFIASLWPHV